MKIKKSIKNGYQMSKKITGRTQKNLIYLANRSRLKYKDSKPYPHIIFKDFFNKDEMVFFKNIKDLSEKLKFYKNNPKIAKNIAKNGQKKYFKLFNGTDVANYIVKRSLNNDPKFKPLWEKIIY